ncbi:MAG: 50S ribosomal protein L21 [Candidatus Pacebacteria bacterium]|nr:50S ribosomal protein L21 [Candidatus Paceibacterota bacterium]MDD5621529.1 50S ribosomal protein L21 [Candidatus Paceibacterota bacterium]
MEFAVIKTGGKQYLVEVGKKIKIEKLDTKEGGSVTFAEVLMIGNDKEMKIGTPFVSSAKVTGTVLKQDKDKKVVTFKYRAKHRYHKTIGHRQPYTMVEIKKIG